MSVVVSLSTFLGSVTVTSIVVIVAYAFIRHAVVKFIEKRRRKNV